ncbi:MAG: response regulator [Bacteriovoracaceae bacterium]
MTKYNILFVDDMSFYKSLVQDHLALWDKDCNLIYCTNAKEATQVLKKTEIHLVICDMMMPEHSGYDLLKSMRQSKKYKEVPFVVLSANDNKKLILESLKAGANKYIIKPWSEEELLLTLDELLS